MLGRAVNAAVAAAVSKRVYDTVSTGPSALRWLRSNHRGEPVTLAQGPAVSAGSLVAVMTAPGIHRSVRAAGVVAIGGASALGMVDDLTGATDIKGIRGHLGALRNGEITTGTVKLVGLGITGLVASALARRGRGGVLDAALAGSVVAGSANLANLFDLRPGRATKVFLAVSAVPVLSAGTPGSILAGPTGAAGALLRADLAERSMLGDTGANALGAAWGIGVVSTLSRPALCATVAALVGLTVASELVSFSQVIERTPGLRELDGLGRRPSQPPSHE